jgi:hypothetical protein
MKKSSEDFVKSIKEKVTQQKNTEIIQRNLLHDSLDYFSSVLSKDGEIEVRNQKKFDSGELNCFLGLYCESDSIPDHINSILATNELEYKVLELDTKKMVYCVNFGRNILSSPHDDNLIFLEFNFKGKHIFECKISPKIGPIDYSLYENKYFNIKVWVFEDGIFNKYEIPLINISRSKRGITRELDGKYKASIIFDLVGEVEYIKISKKRGAKLVTKL